MLGQDRACEGALMRRCLRVIGLLLGLVGSVLVLEYGAAQPLPRAVVLLGAGDIGDCATTGAAETGLLLDRLPGTVFTAGDNAYQAGTEQEFRTCYDPFWGRHKARTRPAPGNHEYNTPGALPYYAYFGGNVPNDTGYYSFDLGAWHILSLNSSTDFSAGSPQGQWLRADLSAHPATCTLAIWHHPLFSSGVHGNDATMQPLWDVLYAAHADIVINGHDHDYERFAPQNPLGQADPIRGIREFVVGTGGATLRPFVLIRANSQYRNNTDWGVLQLTLHATSYNWAFVPVTGAVVEQGTGTCVP
jgi:hypothetical protein